MNLDDVSTLDHETLYHTVEDRPLVPYWGTTLFKLPSAELPGHKIVLSALSA